MRQRTMLGALMGGISRRNVLKMGATALAGAAVAPSLSGVLAGRAGAASPTSSGTPSGTASGAVADQAHFDDLIGQDFILHTPGGDQVVPLLAVVPHPAAAPVGGECFSLFFAAPSPVAPSGTYQLSQPALGTFSLFLHPVGPPATGQEYEAVVTTR